MEYWKEIRDYTGYEVSSYGRIYSNKSGKILKLKSDKYGYKVVNLYNLKESRKKTQLVHRLVANAFIPNPKNKPQVNHINFNRSDNKVKNLEWTTAKENVKHSFKHGRIKIGEDIKTAKFTDMDIWNIKFGYIGVSNTQISKLYNVSKRTIETIKYEKRRWKHVIRENGIEIARKTINSICD